MSLDLLTIPAGWRSLAPSPASRTVAAFCNGPGDPAYDGKQTLRTERLRSQRVKM